MQVEFDKSFSKSIDKITIPAVKIRLAGIIENLENAESIREISHVRKLTGFKSYYRIRFGKYRIGLELINPQKIRLIIVATRKDIYKVFP